MPQRLTLGYLYEVPIGRGRRWSSGKPNYLLGGWRFSGDVTFASGLPFTLFCCKQSQDQFGSVDPDDIRVNVDVNPNQGFKQSGLQWFNTSVESAPTPGTFGNIAKNTLRGSSQREADVAFMKDFPLKENGPRFDYRLEIFNFLLSSSAFSHLPNNYLVQSPQNCIPGASGTCLFGSLVPLNGLGALNLCSPYTVQMALKFIW